MHTVIRAGLALGAGILFAAPVFSQERRSEVVATYNGLNLPPVVHPLNSPKNAFSYEYAGRDAWLKKVGRGVVGAKGTSPGVGILDWVVPDEQFGTAGLDRQFRTYCAESPVPVTAGYTYRFELYPPAVPEAYKLEENEAGNAEALRRSQYVRELFGRYYIPSTSDARAAKAFQVALWEIIHEPTWGAPDKPAPLDLTKGSFTAAKEQADPETVSLAKTYLASLTGNDNIYYENPDLAGRELVWMKGLESPQVNGNTFVAQSQFALQYVKGGAVPSANADPTGTPAGGGGLPVLGGGAFGGGGGGGGGLYGGGGGAGGFPATNPNNVPSTTTTPPTTNVPPINSPPVNPPDTPTNPVPAPAGIVLGVIAVGSLLGRKVLMRR